MRILVITALLLTLHAVGRPVELTLPSVFTDHMMFQRDQPVPVWGEAMASAEITVAFAGQTKTTKADAAGKWMVHLDPMPASAEPRELAVSSNLKFEISNLKFPDVLVGEVWLCSGQSNMEWIMGKLDRFAGVEHGEEEIAKPERAGIRIFSDEAEFIWEKRGWQRCGGEALRRFSATAFFFGNALHWELGVPVGLVNVSRGGTTIQAWTRGEFAQRNPFTRHYTELYQSHRAEIGAFNKAMVDARTKHTPAPEPLSREVELARLFNGPVLYDQFVEPIAPFAVRGVIWYQGEANAKDPANAQAHGSMLRDLIEGWRERWARKEMPWYVVQAPCNVVPQAKDLPAVRQGQWEVARTMPNVGLVTICDFADPKIPHHPQKRETGERIALSALAKTYGKAIPCEGPVVKSLRAESSSLIAEFDARTGPIQLKGGVWNDVELAGDDGVYHAAQATFDGLRATIVSDRVSQPKAMRYGWHPVFTPSLFNTAGLPAALFEMKVGPG